MKNIFNDLKHLFNNYPKTAIGLLLCVTSFILISIVFAGDKIQPEVGENFIVDFFDKNKEPSEVCSIVDKWLDEFEECLSDKQSINSDSSTYTVKY